MVEWHHQLSGHEFEQTPRDGGGQGSLARCSPWGCMESDTTGWLNNTVILACLPITGIIERTWNFLLFPEWEYSYNHPDNIIVSHFRNKGTEA